MSKKNNGKKKTLAREVGEIILAFAVAWIGYNALSYATGTNMPIVAVVSDSMYHTNTFDNWWQSQSRGQFYERLGISEQQFISFPDSNGLSKGDLLFVVKGQPHVGDIVIYEKPEQGISIVHRFVGIDSNGQYIIKGDNNYVADAPVPPQNVVGRVAFAVPLLGYPRFVLFAFGV